MSTFLVSLRKKNYRKHYKRASWPVARILHLEEEEEGGGGWGLRYNNVFTGTCVVGYHPQEI